MNGDHISIRGSLGYEIMTKRDSKELKVQIIPIRCIFSFSGLIIGTP